LEVGGLSVATARDVIDAVDSELSLAHSFGVTQRAVSAKIDPGDIDPSALAGIDRLVEGWQVSGDNPGRLAAARVLETFESLGQRDERSWFSRYAAAALLVAEADLDQVEARGSREHMAETVVIGTVLGDALFFRASPCRARACLNPAPFRPAPARPHPHPGVKMSATATTSFSAGQTRWHRPLLWLSLAMAVSALATLAGRLTRTVRNLTLR
jgi:hypothetical protein